MTQKYTIKFFEGDDGFRQIEDDWNIVFRSLSRKRFFYRYEWYKCYMETLKPKEEIVYFFIIYNQDIPLAIFPLIKGIKQKYGIKIKVWETPLHNHLVFSDFIYDVNDANKDILIFLIKYLSNGEIFNNDGIIIYNVLEDSILLQSINYISPLFTVIKNIGEYSFFYIENFKKGIKRKKSKSTNKKRNELQKLGKVEFTRSVGKSDILRDFNIFLDVEASGWKGAQGTAIKCNEMLIKFYRCLITELVHIGGCHIYLLYVNDECIAGNFCIVDDDTIYTLKIGYREDYALYSPGIICRDNLLNMISEYEDIKYVNFVTHQEWHDRWDPELCSIYNVYIYNISIGGIIAFMTAKGKQWIKKLYIKFTKDN